MRRLSCRLFRSNEVWLWLSIMAYHLGNCGGGWCCRRGLTIVVDESATKIDEDRRLVGQARAVLLADAGRKPSDAAAVRGDGATDCGLAGGNWLEGG